MRLVFGVRVGSAFFARRSGSTQRARPFDTISPSSCPHVFSVDNGRVLGFDNAHGTHERHYMGEVTPVPFAGYLETMTLFYREAEALRRSYEE